MEKIEQLFLSRVEMSVFEMSQLSAAHYFLSVSNFKEAEYHLKKSGLSRQDIQEIIASEKSQLHQSVLSD